MSKLETAPEAYSNKDFAIQLELSRAQKKLKALREEVEAGAFEISQTLENYYEKTIPDNPDATQRIYQGKRDIECTLKEKIFPITFKRKDESTTISFRIAFFRESQGGELARIYLEAKGTKYIIENGDIKVADEESHSRVDAGGRILDYSYEEFNKALLASKPATVSAATTAEKPKPITFPQANTSPYEAFDDATFASLLLSTTTLDTNRYAQKLIEKYGYIGLLTQIQVLDGVITQQQAIDIGKGYDHFKSAVLSEYTQWTQQDNIFQTAGQYGNLKKITDPHTRVFVFSLLSYYRKHVQYQTQGNYGRTFLGFAGYRDAESSFRTHGLRYHEYCSNGYAQVTMSKCRASYKLTIKRMAALPLPQTMLIRK